MGVKLKIPAAFGTATKGVTMIEVNGDTVGACLKELVKQFPALEKMLFDETDQLSRRLAIYVNGRCVERGGLDEALKDGDEVYLLNMVSGG